MTLDGDSCAQCTALIRNRQLSSASAARPSDHIVAKCYSRLAYGHALRRQLRSILESDLPTHSRVLTEQKWAKPTETGLSIFRGPCSTTLTLSLDRVILYRLVPVALISLHGWDCTKLAMADNNRAQVPGGIRSLASTTYAKAIHTYDLPLAF